MCNCGKNKVQKVVSNQQSKEAVRQNPRVKVVARKREDK